MEKMITKTIFLTDQELTKALSGSHSLEGVINIGAELALVVEPVNMNEARRGVMVKFREDDLAKIKEKAHAADVSTETIMVAAVQAYIRDKRYLDWTKKTK